MLQIKTYLSVSNIPDAGLGLFADQDISAGTCIWVTNRHIDILLPSLETIGLSEVAKTQIHNYAWWDKELDAWVLPGDNARFMNHSNHPNCDDSYPNTTIALVDIKRGDEITVDYRTFHGEEEEYY